MTDGRDRLTTALAERYRIERELGQGGMATVYLAHDLKHDRPVAIKVLRPELAAVIGAPRPSEGGIEPRWSKHGREIVYRDRGGFLAVPVAPGADFTIGRTDSLFQGTYLLSGVRAQYDVSPDGSEFLVVGAPPESRTLLVTLNPFGGLRDGGRPGAKP
jgi:hypothetical protein